MANFNVSFNEYVLRAITCIRNNKQRPDNETILYYIKKNFATNVDSATIDATLNNLINEHLLENRPIIKVIHTLLRKS